MKTIGRIFASLTVVLLMVLSSCGVRTIQGSGVVIEEVREVGEFRGINIEGMGRLILTQGDDSTLSIEADDNFLEFITTGMRGSVLHIQFKGNYNLVPTETIIIRIGLTDLESITSSGGLSIESKWLAVEGLEVKLSGATSMNIDWLTATELKITSEGVGNIVLAGKVERQEVELNGLGNYTAPDLQSQTTVITIGGSGNAVVWVEETLDVSIDGRGDVSYFGSPEVDYDDSGFGDLRGLGDK